MMLKASHDLRLDHVDLAPVPADRTPDIRLTRRLMGEGLSLQDAVRSVGAFLAGIHLQTLEGKTASLT